MTEYRPVQVRRPAACLFYALLCVGAALLVPATALAAYGPKGGIYGGKATGSAVSNRVHPVSASLSKDGKKIAILRLTVSATCDVSGALTSPEAWTDVKIARDGSFSDSGKFVQRGSDGSETTWESQVQGRLGAAGGRGKARDVATVRDSEGNVTNTCDTGVVRFDLDRGDRVFGGRVVLGQGYPAFGAIYPVSVERNRRGSRLTSFRIRYLAKCGPSNYHANSFEHFNIGLDRSGRFSISRKFTYRSTSGTTRYTGTVTLRGQLGARRGSGTYRSKFRARLSNGDEIPCDTGRRKWSVSRR